MHPRLFPMTMLGGPAPLPDSPAFKLPAIYYHPAAVRSAKEEGVDVLTWWQGFAQGNAIAQRVLTEAAPLAEKGLSLTRKIEAFNKLEGMFDKLAAMRKDLDRLKGVVPAAQWNRWNADWYGWMASLSVGFVPTNRPATGFGEPMSTTTVVVIVVVALITLISVILITRSVNKASDTVRFTVEECARTGKCPTIKPTLIDTASVVWLTAVAAAVLTLPKWGPMLAGLKLPQGRKRTGLKAGDLD